MIVPLSITLLLFRFSSLIGDFVVETFEIYGRMVHVEIQIEFNMLWQDRSARRAMWERKLFYLIFLGFAQSTLSSGIRQVSPPHEQLPLLSSRSFDSVTSELSEFNGKLKEI